MDYTDWVRQTVYSVIEGVSAQGEDAFVPMSALWAEKGFFVVEISCKAFAEGIDEVEVVVDCDGVSDDGRMRGVGIDDCAALSREIAEQLRRVLPKTVGPAGEEEEADFSLTVMSAGLGRPLKLGRQYRKLMQRAVSEEDGSLPCVDVLFRDGRKLTGVVLCGIGYDNDTEEDVPSAIEVMYEVKELIPDRPKRKYHMVEKREQIVLAETKAVTEHFDFK